MEQQIPDEALTCSVDECTTVVETIRKSGLRSVNRRMLLVSALALGLGFFTLYTSYFGILESWRQRMIHLLFILGIFFMEELAFKEEGTLKKFINVLAILGIISVAIYSYIDYQNIIFRLGRPNLYDQIFGTILLILVFIASYKKLGWAITILISFFVFYALFGNVFPGVIYHRGMTYRRFIDFLFNQTSGILGPAMRVSAEYIIMFIMFGAFLKKSGAGDYFIDLSLTLTRKMWGGPAKTAVIASAIMGTINSSAVGNAVATGAITIPLMKKAGYKPHFAAGVEAAASTGGMIMPPVMATVAFLIAIFTNTPYAQVMIHGLIPASLYFLAIFIMVHLEAKKNNLSPKMMQEHMKDDGRTKLQVFLGGWYFLLPLFLLIVLLVQGFSPMRVALFSIVLVTGLSFFKKQNRMGIWEILAAIEEGARNTVVVAIACASAGVIIGVIGGTGLGAKFSMLILALGGGNLLFVLVLTMFASLILGMGMTAAPVYIIVSGLITPALIELGVTVIPAHFFVYYYGIASAVTPPIALAAYGAAGIAGASQTKTAFAACKLAVIAFLIPFAFVLNPALLAIGPFYRILLSVITALMGVLALSAALTKWLIRKTPLPQQLLLLIAGIGLLYHIPMINVLGGIIILGVFLYQKIQINRTESLELETE